MLFDEKAFRQIIREELSTIQQEKTSEWPPMLDQTDIMKFFRCTRPIASRLMNRQDFPKVPDVGRKCVPLHLLYEWLNDHADYVKENTSFWDKEAI